MQPWNLEDTRNHVNRRYGDSQLRVVRKCLESIVDRQRYAGYHFHEHRRLLSEHIDAKLSSKSIFELTFPFEPTNQEELDWCLTRVSANVVACVQSMHSLADILAYVIYFSLGLNLSANPLKERDVSLTSVIRVLRKDPSYEALAARLDDIARHPDFTYLSALVNHSKHRSIVGAVLSVDGAAEGKPPYTLLFEAFSYSDTLYDHREIEPFLEPTYAWLSHAIVACGNTLNEVVAK